MPLGERNAVKEQSDRKNCPLCLGSAWTSTIGGLLTCLSCGLTVDPGLWEPQANEKMEEEWFEGSMPSDDDVWVRAFTSRNNRRVWRDVRSYLPAGARVLDVGVGNGSLLRFLRAQGVNVEGCDLSRSICERVRSRDGISMHNCALSDISPAQPFDAVLMCHVLEHVSDPVHFLADAARLLKPGGVVYLRLPNRECWEARLPGWTSYAPYHLTYFGRATLRKAVEGAGLRILGLWTHESFSGWFLTLFRTVCRKGEGTRQALPQQHRTSRRRTGPLAHAYHAVMVASGILTLPLRWLQQTLMRGDELVAVTTRKSDVAR